MYKRQEQGYQLRYPIRAIVGDNEETHMNDVKYYLENYPAPVFCFTPDAEFPVCNGCLLYTSRCV